jgi:hypothetical protein
VLHNVLAQVVAYEICIPAGVVEEVLDPSWSRLADGGFGHLPRVLAPNVG